MCLEEAWFTEEVSVQHRGELAWSGEEVRRWKGWALVWASQSWKPWNTGGAGAISTFGSCQENGLIVKPNGQDLEL